MQSGSWLVLAAQTGLPLPQFPLSAGKRVPLLTQELLGPLHRVPLKVDAVTEKLKLTAAHLACRQHKTTLS